VTQWWVVYGDRSIYRGSGAEDAYAAPTRDVQAVLSPCPDHGWELWRRWNTDYYVYLHGLDRWRGVDQFGLYDYLCEPGPKRVLFGRTMLDEEYRALLQWLTTHPDLPTKSGWQQGEGD
jgi:hypothetical protein